MRLNLLKTVQFADDLQNRFQTNLKEAINTLAADHDLLSVPATVLTVTGAIQPGKSVVVFGGNTGQKLTLPLSKAQGANVSALVVFANTSGNTVTLVPAGTDTLNGAKTLAVAAGTVVVLVSDGATKWLALSAGGSGGITQLTGDIVAGPGSGSQAAAFDASGLAKIKTIASYRP